MSSTIRRSRPPPQQPPSPSQQQQDEDKDRRPPLWKVWLVAARPHTLTASISPVLVGHYATLAYGGAAAAASTTTAVSLLASVSRRWLLFCMLIQLGTNLHNDYADFVLGADTEKRQGQARATQRGWIAPRDMATAATLCLTLALVVGMSLMVLLDLPNQAAAVLALVIFTSIFNAFAYTGGDCYPFIYLGKGVGRVLSIGYSGWGDVVCFVYFGLVATLMVPYLWTNSALSSRTKESLLQQQQQHASANLLWSLLACQMGCFATAILVVNNIRDCHTDVLANKRTLAVRFGVMFCRFEYAVLVLLPYISLFWIKALVKHDMALLPVITLPLFLTPHLRAVSGGDKEGAALNPHVGGTAKVQFFFCVLQCVSLYAQTTKQVNISDNKV